MPRPVTHVPEHLCHLCDWYVPNLMKLNSPATGKGRIVQFGEMKLNSAILLTAHGDKTVGLADVAKSI